MSSASLLRAFALAGLLPSVAAAQSSVPLEGPEGPLFTDRARELGIDFVHFNGMSGEYYIAENLGGGGALFDYDNDGDLDVFLVQGNLIGPRKKVSDATFPPRHSLPLTDRLYRNDLAVDAAGKPVARFVDVTETSGLEAFGYGMGVTSGDYDNDGWIDLYVTNFGSNHLLKNQGDGTFRDVTVEAGADDPRWSVPASFLDYDGDGWLDLFVGNYLEFSLGLHSPCPDATGAPGYCAPQSYGPQGDRLLRNRGDGTFADVTVDVGMEGETGPALGSIAADFNGDGLVDLYVANDMMPNLLWVNNGDGTLRNDALLAGCAVNWEGEPEASMGVDAADFDGDGDEDLIMGHLTDQTNTLFVNDGTGIFRDTTISAGLGYPSRTYTTFGTVWIDFDNDGWLDLLTANGTVSIISTLLQQGDPYPLHQPNQLFRHLGGGKFVEVTAEAGEVFELSEVSRGVALGDVDNDGDLDALLANNAGPVRLLINEVGQRNEWIGFRMLAGEPPSDRLGARIEAEREDGSIHWRRVRTDGSFASANDPRIVLGLGAKGTVTRFRTHWTGGGETEEFFLPTSGKYLILHHRESGSGR